MPTPVYPSLDTDTKDSKQQPIEDLVVDQWPNGNSRGRSYFTTGKYAWDLKHGVLSDANRITLKAFYDANRLLLRTNMAAGHGGASGRWDFLREVAFKYAFVLMAIGH